MAANGGHHFEINMKVQNYETLKNIHTLALLTTVIFIYYVNNDFMGLF